MLILYSRWYKYKNELAFIITLAVSLCAIYIRFLFFSFQQPGVLEPSSWLTMAVSLAIIFGIFFGLLALVTMWHFYCKVSIPCICITNANILITGGSEGIGLSMAKACIAKGANVAILARNKQKLSNEAEQLSKLKQQSNSSKIITISADVSNYDQMHREITSAFENKQKQTNSIFH